MDLTDDNNNYNNSNYYVYDWYSYQDAYGDGRKLSYNHFAVDMNSKLFIIHSGRVRPYVGVAVAYNRTNLSFFDKQTFYDQYGLKYGNEEFNSSYISARAGIGSEIRFSETVGLNLEVSFAKGLGSGFDYDSALDNKNNDQRRLNQLGREIEDAGFMTVNGGLLVSF